MKAFVAAMLALYCALALGLPRPYWAMATVYVVSHPLSGATRSKGVYRALGTLLGAAGSVVIVPTLGSEPVLFSLVLALWTGLLMYFALLDRTPRSYLYMLAAYSLGLIALPAITTPEQIFDIAIARSEEILLGILCASVVSAVVFPTRILPLLQAKLNAWLKDAAGWAGAILSAADGAQAAKATAMAMMLEHATNFMRLPSETFRFEMPIAPMRGASVTYPVALIDPSHRRWRPFRREHSAQDHIRQNGIKIASVSFYDSRV